MAMDVHEQEQVEALKGWWQQNGTFILVSLLIFLTAIAGWRGWQYYQDKQAKEAVTLFESFLKQMDSDDPKRVNAAADEVVKQFDQTIYASYASLFAARFNEHHKDEVRTKQQLQWVISNGKEETLKDVARLRLAAILLDEKKLDDALKLLDNKHSAQFDMLFADLRGDILAAQGKNKEALTAYKLAFEKTEEKGMYRNFIQMKMDDLGEVQ